MPVAADVFFAAFAELARQHGLPPVPTGREPLLRVYEHLLETGIFEVAELDGKIVGFAAATVRDSLWFLAMFFMLPEYKSQGIGRPLLERVQQLGEARGASVRGVWSSPDRAAIASYLKLGMMPVGPIFTFAGPLLSEPAAHPEARLVELDAGQASAIDRVVRGVTREQDHAFWRAGELEGFQLEVAQRPIGYFYVKDGVIGPAAWTEPVHGAALVSHALRHASTTAAEVKLIALGVNQTAIQQAIGAGLRLVATSHFLSSSSLGKLDCYLPSGPALF